MIQKNKKTMIKEKGKEICQRVLDTNLRSVELERMAECLVYLCETLNVSQIKSCLKEISYEFQGCNSTEALYT